jgi:hypothetical protein
VRGQQAGWEGASGLVCLLWQCCGGLCRSLVVFTGEMIWWRLHVMGGKHTLHCLWPLCLRHGAHADACLCWC